MTRRGAALPIADCRFQILELEVSGLTSAATGCVVGLTAASWAQREDCLSLRAGRVEAGPLRRNCSPLVLTPPKRETCRELPQRRRCHTRIAFVRANTTFFLLSTKNLQLFCIAQVTWGQQVTTSIASFLPRTLNRDLQFNRVWGAGN